MLLVNDTWTSLLQQIDNDLFCLGDSNRRSSGGFTMSMEPKAVLQRTGQNANCCISLPESSSMSLLQSLMSGPLKQSSLLAESFISVPKLSSMPLVLSPFLNWMSRAATAPADSSFMSILRASYPSSCSRSINLEH